MNKLLDFIHRFSDVAEVKHSSSLLSCLNKTLVALSLIFAVSVEAMAQTEEVQDRFHWGFKGGINFTTFDSDADDFQARMGQWGMLCRWDIGEHFAIQPELFYARMGVRQLEKVIKCFDDNEDPYIPVNDNKNQRFAVKLLTDNVQIPVFFKWYLPVNFLGGKGLNIHVAPMFSWAFDYTISTNSPEGFLLDPALNEKTDLLNIARGRNEITFQAVGGIGYDSPSGIGFDIRYQQGVTPVWKDTKNRPAFNPNAHDRVWAICFSYTF